jgi:hypothetical protein
MSGMRVTPGLQTRPQKARPPHLCLQLGCIAKQHDCHRETFSKAIVDEVVTYPERGVRKKEGTRSQLKNLAAPDV